MSYRQVLVLCSVLLTTHRVQSGAMQAIGVQNALYEVPGLGNRPLFIKMYPAVENYQSDLYEVYAEPYNYVRSAVPQVNNFFCCFL